MIEDINESLENYSLKLNVMIKIPTSKLKNRNA